MRRLLASFGTDPLLRSVDFRRFWLSSALNGFGGQITSLAFPLCAAVLLHASPAQMGTLVALQLAPFAVLSLPVGVWLDRSRKRPIILACDLMYAVILASVPCAYWLGWLSITWLYAVGMLVGTVQVLGGGAEQIFLTQMVGREQLIDAQSKFAVTDSGARLLGPGLAGLLIQALSAPAAMMVNAVGFLLSFWNVLRIRAHDPLPAPTHTHPLRAIADGIAFVWQHPILRALAIGSCIWNILFYGYTALLVLFATRELGMTAGMLGVAQMAGGGGILLSSMIMKPLVRRVGAGVAILSAMGTTAVGFALMAMLPRLGPDHAFASTALYGGVTFVFDCGVMLYLMPYLALRQRVTPNEFLGRMVATMRFLTVATAPLGAMAAGAVAERYGVRTSLACIAATCVALTATMALASPLRTVKD